MYLMKSAALSHKPWNAKTKGMPGLDLVGRRDVQEEGPLLTARHHGPHHRAGAGAICSRQRTDEAVCISSLIAGIIAVPASPGSSSEPVV